MNFGFVMIVIKNLEMTGGTKMKIIGLIPARKESKRLPNKNFKILNGKIMFEYTMEAAIDSGVFNEIIMSTDNKGIRTTHKEVEIRIRPDFLCQDDTPMVEVVLWEMRKEPDDTVVCLLQPTSPLRTHKDIKDALIQFIYESYYYKSLISYTTYDLSRSPKENGAFFIATIGNIRTLGHWRKFRYICKYFMPLNRSVDVDTIEDFKRAERLLKGEEKLMKKCKRCGNELISNLPYVTVPFLWCNKCHKLAEEEWDIENNDGFI